MNIHRIAYTIIATLSLGAAHAAESESQTIVVFGASGKIGSLIVQEALANGHKVVGISRNPDKFEIDNENFIARAGDVTDVESFREVTAGADAVAISVSGSSEPYKPETSVHALAAVTAVAAYSGVEDSPHVLQIGGGSTMLGDNDKQAMLEGLPFKAEEGSAMYAMLFGHYEALNTYRASDINWTVLTPPFMIRGWSPRELLDAETTKGSYRTSTTERVYDADGKNEIFVRDLAKAAIDEIENRKFVQQRFTVGY